MTATDPRTEAGAPADAQHHFEALGRSGAWNDLYRGPETTANISFRVRLERTLELLPADARRVLDVGCGPSPLGAPLIGRGVTYCGLDLAAAMLSGARAAEPRALLVQGGAALPFREESFDAVVALGFLEYLDDIPRALREMRRVVRPGGTIVVSVPKAVHIDVITVSALAPLRGLAALTRGRRSDRVRRTYLNADDLDAEAVSVGLRRIRGAHYHYTPVPYPLTQWASGLSLSLTRRFERSPRLRALTFFAHGYLGSYRRE
jgi:SAM-dependent methyltransferase